MTSIQYENLVFEGGGAKGIAFCGSIKACDEQGIIKKIKRIAGSSAGSIMAAAIAIGYEPDEIKKVLISTDFSKFKDGNYGVVGYIYRILHSYGIFAGDIFYNWIGTLVKEKTGNVDTTLKDVFDKYGIELVITGSCVNKNKVVYFNYKDHPDLTLRLAVRISCSLPYVFHSIKYKGDLYIDGGVLDNYPIWYFGDDGKTLGFKLVNPNDRRDNQIYHTNNQINNIIDFSTNIINAMLEQIDKMHIKDKYWQHTITIDTLGILSTEFNLTDEQKDSLIKSGYDSAKKFFAIFALNGANELRSPSFHH